VIKNINTHILTQLRKLIILQL